MCRLGSSRGIVVAARERAGCALDRGCTLDLLNALDAATDEFGRRVALVESDDWTRATPCTGWDVHYLVAHVVGGNRFAVLILGGAAASEAIDVVMSAPQLGDDASTAWMTTSAEQSAAFRAEKVLESRVDHPLGEITGREFLEFRVFDITLHAWDLARASRSRRSARRRSGRCRSAHRRERASGYGFRYQGPRCDGLGRIASGETPRPDGSRGVVARTCRYGRSRVRTPRTERPRRCSVAPASRRSRTRRSSTARQR